MLLEAFEVFWRRLEMGLVGRIFFFPLGRDFVSPDLLKGLEKEEAGEQQRRGWRSLKMRRNPAKENHTE
jgi:hypothetical protein